jgi:hypothetical protein
VDRRGQVAPKRPTAKGAPQTVQFRPQACAFGKAERLRRGDRELRGKTVTFHNASSRLRSESVNKWLTSPQALRQSVWPAGAARIVRPLWIGALQPYLRPNNQNQNLSF